MKLLIASDIHGSARCCGKLMEAVEREAPDQILLLGDLLYHGPRNVEAERPGGGVAFRRRAFCGGGEGGGSGQDGGQNRFSKHGFVLLCVLFCVALLGWDRVALAGAARQGIHGIRTG